MHGENAKNKYLNFCYALSEGKFIDDKEEVTFEKDDTLKTDDILKLQIYSLNNNNTNLLKDEKFIEQQAKDLYNKSHKKTEDKNKVNIDTRPSKIDVNFEELYTELLDIETTVEDRAKNIKREETTGWEDFLDFFINLLGLGETYEEEKQNAYKEKINELINQIDNENIKILSKKKKIVQDVIQNFNNGYELQEDEFKTMVDILQKDGLTSAINGLNEAKNMCHTLYEGKKNKANENLLTVYNAQNVDGPEMD